MLDGTTVLALFFSTSVILIFVWYIKSTSKFKSEHLYWSSFSHTKTTLAIFKLFVLALYQFMSLCNWLSSLLPNSLLQNTHKLYYHEFFKPSVKFLIKLLYGPIWVFNKVTVVDLYMSLICIRSYWAKVHFCAVIMNSISFTLPWVIPHCSHKSAVSKVAAVDCMWQNTFKYLLLSFDM